MKKIMTLAIIALASVAMVACGGQQKPAAEKECCKECTECPKAAEEAAPAADTPAEAPAETPAPEAAPAK